MQLKPYKMMYTFILLKNYILKKFEKNNFILNVCRIALATI